MDFIIGCVIGYLVCKYADSYVIKAWEYIKNLFKSNEEKND